MRVCFDLFLVGFWWFELPLKEILVLPLFGEFLPNLLSIFHNSSFCFSAEFSKFGLKWLLVQILFLVSPVFSIVSSWICSLCVFFPLYQFFLILCKNFLNLSLWFCFYYVFCLVIVNNWAKISFLPIQFSVFLLSFKNLDWSCCWFRLFSLFHLFLV